MKYCRIKEELRNIEEVFLLGFKKYYKLYK